MKDNRELLVGRWYSERLSELAYGVYMGWVTIEECNALGSFYRKRWMQERELL